MTTLIYRNRKNNLTKKQKNNESWLNIQGLNKKTTRNSTHIGHWVAPLANIETRLQKRKSIEIPWLQPPIHFGKNRSPYGTVLVDSSLISIVVTKLIFPFPLSVETQRSMQWMDNGISLVDYPVQLAQNSRL